MHHIKQNSGITDFYNVFFVSQNLSKVANDCDLAGPLNVSTINIMQGQNQFTGIDYLPPNTLLHAKNVSTKQTYSCLSQNSKKVGFISQQRPVSHLKITKEQDPSLYRQSTEPSRTNLEEIKFRERFKQLNSLPITQISSSLNLKYCPLEPIIEEPMQQRKRVRLQSLQKDKQKIHIKYKVFRDRLGLEAAKVILTDEAEIMQGENQKIKQKGNQYLKESRAKDKCRRPTHCKTGSEDDAKRYYVSPKKDRLYIRQIFKEVAQEARQKAEAQLFFEKKKSKKALKAHKLLEHEQRLGQNVYKRVANHLQVSHKHKLSYVQQLNGQQKVDEALIKLIQFKLKRLTTLVH